MYLKKIFFLVLIISAIFLSVPIYAITISEIAADLKTAPKNPALFAELSQLTPKNEKEIYLLFDLVANSKGTEREKVIESIAKVQDKKYNHIFLKELKNSHAMIRAISAGMCGKMKIEEANETLKQMVLKAPPIKDFPDEDEERALATAVLALGELQKEDSLDVLVSLLGKIKSYEVQSLRKFGVKALPALIAKINDKETDSKARLAAIQVLMAIQDKEALPLLEKEAENPQSPSRPYTVTTLLNLSPDVYLPRFIAQWEDKPESDLASRLLYYLDSRREKNPGLSSFYIKILESDYDPALKIMAINALSRNGGQDAHNALKKAAQDKNEKVRLYANQALEFFKE